MEDAAVAVVLDLDGRVDAAGGDEVDDAAIGLFRGDFDGLAWFEIIVEGDLEGFGAVEFEDFARLPFTELQRQDAHADEV